MIRVKRVEANTLGDVSKKLLSLFEDLRLELVKVLGSENLSFLPLVKEKDGFINFYTNLQGNCVDVSKEQLTQEYKSLSLKALHTLSLIKDYFLSKNTLDNKDLEGYRQNFLLVLLNSSRFLIIDNKFVVILPFLLKDEEAVALKQGIDQKRAKVVTTVATPFAHWPCLVGFLLFLLLLLFLWWFFLRPWPMSGGFFDRINAYRTYPEAIESHQRILADIKSLEDYLDKQNLLKEKNKALALQNEALEKQKLLDEQKAKAQEELLQMQKEKEELLKEKQLLEEQKQKALEIEKQKKLLAQKEVKDKAQSVKNKFNDLPKCSVLRKEGKMPQMVIAFDGSSSMFETDMGYGVSRLDAAIKAADALVKSTDKNVNIGLVEINGCPVSKNYGFFSGKERSKLLNYIHYINPYNYDGKTPLVHGLNTMTDMVDGVKSDAVGVLISDGEDTCPFTSDMDVCVIAKNIHAQKPRLKIHTILIGDNAREASCIAKYTGGKVYSAKNASQIISNLKAAGASVQKVCKE